MRLCPGTWTTWRCWNCEAHCPRYPHLHQPGPSSGSSLHFAGWRILGIRMIHSWVLLSLNLTLNTYRYLLPETALKQMPKPRRHPDKNKGGILTYTDFRVVKPIWCSLCAWDFFLLGVIQSSQPRDQGTYTPAVFSPLFDHEWYEITQARFQIQPNKWNLWQPNSCWASQ